MSETTTEKPTETKAETEHPLVQGDPAKGSEDKPLGENGEKALKAEREARTAAEREKAALQQELDTLKRANESDSERLQREAREAREALTTGVTEAFREAAVTFGGINAEDADLFLTGSDKETLRKQALRLVEKTPTAMLPDPSQGGSGQSTALNGDGLEQALKTKLGIT